MNRTIRSAIVGLSALSLSAFGSAAQAVNLVTNGDFTSTTNGGGDLGFNTTATGWTNNSGGYNFLFTPGTADNGGVTGRFGNLQLWGPNNGSINGLPANSPAGGNFIAADGAFGVGAISQVINGLNPGQDYILSFYDAGAQQKGFDGATSDQWHVTLGGQKIDSTKYTNVDHGFTGWNKQSLTFTATATQETLSFLAEGSPAIPPFSLLAGVSLDAVDPTAVPEPIEVAGTIAGFGLCLALRSKLAKKK